MLPAALIATHLALGLGLLALVAATFLLAAPRALRDGPPPAAYHVLHRVAAALIGVQVLIGALLYAQGRRPLTGVHLVYGVAAVLVMPVARALVRRDPSRARLYQIGGTLLLLGVVFRLVTTGPG